MDDFPKASEMMMRANNLQTALDTAWKAKTARVIRAANDAGKRSILIEGWTEEQKRFLENLGYKAEFYSDPRELTDFYQVSW